MSYNRHQQGIRPIFRPAGSTDPGELEAFLCVERSGEIVAAWSRNSSHHELVGVMTATIFGAAEGLVEDMGGGVPDTIFVESEQQQVMMLRSADGRMCVGSARLGLPKREHRSALRRLLDALPGAEGVEVGLDATTPNVWKAARAR